jgi:hypothetical protein
VSLLPPNKLCLVKFGHHLENVLGLNNGTLIPVFGLPSRTLQMRNIKSCGTTLNNRPVQHCLTQFTNVSKVVQQFGLLNPSLMVRFHHQNKPGKGTFDPTMFVHPFAILNGLGNCIGRKLTFGM